MAQLARRGFLTQALCGCGVCAFAPSLLARVSPADMRPFVTAGYEPKDVDERGMWQIYERFERDLAASNLLVRDPALMAYLHGIMERLLGEMAADLRIYVVRDPEANASMGPTGLMIVHTGLLARMRNEAQLASVLGHEAGHYLRRHSLQRWRDLKTKSALMSIVALGGAAAGGPSGTNYYSLANAINVTILLSMLSFSREHESEADAYGLKLMHDGHYPATAASEVWAQIIDERRASAAERKKKYRDRANSALSTHPPTVERMSDLAASAQELQRPDPDGAGYDDRRAEYMAAIAPFRPMLIDEQVKLNDPGASLYLINALAQDGWDATLRYYEGEIYRLRDEPGDGARASESYAAAVQFSDALPESFRAHGYALIKSGNVEEGRRSLERYLELHPNATDAAMVRFSLAQER
jgi:predicted Zn-dependent protease